MKLKDLKWISENYPISVFTLRKFARDGLPHIRIGRKILVDPEKLEEWLYEYHGNCSEAQEKDMKQFVKDVFAELD